MFLIAFKSLKVYLNTQHCLKSTNYFFVAVLMGISRWHWPPKPLSITLEEWNGSRPQFTNPPVRSTSSISHSTSKPASWNSVHGLTMVSRSVNKTFRHTKKQLRWTEFIQTKTTHTYTHSIMIQQFASVEVFAWQLWVNLVLMVISQKARLTLQLVYLS